MMQDHLIIQSVQAYLAIAFYCAAVYMTYRIIAEFKVVCIIRNVYIYLYMCVFGVIRPSKSQNAHRYICSCLMSLLLFCCFAPTSCSTNESNDLVCAIRLMGNLMQVLPTLLQLYIYIHSNECETNEIKNYS